MRKICVDRPRPTRTAHARQRCPKLNGMSRDYTWPNPSRIVLSTHVVPSTGCTTCNCLASVIFTKVSVFELVDMSWTWKFERFDFYGQSIGCNIFIWYLYSVALFPRFHHVSWHHMSNFAILLEITTPKLDFQSTTVQKNQIEL